SGGASRPSTGDVSGCEAADVTVVGQSTDVGTGRIQPRHGLPIVIEDLAVHAGAHPTEGEGDRGLDQQCIERGGARWTGAGRHGNAARDTSASRGDFAVSLYCRAQLVVVN